jgi:hypothetical protein
MLTARHCSSASTEVDPGLERYTPSMITATLLASVLAVAPQPLPQPPPFEVADVEFGQTPDTAQLTAFDGDGEVVGEIVVWRDSVGQPMIAATFVDGLYMFASIDGDTATIDIVDGATVHARLLTVQAALGPQESWWTCAIDVAATGAACAGAAALPNPVTVGACGAGLYTSFCACGHAAKPKFECY